MTKRKTGLSRRGFLERVGVAGGSAALYETMTALGLDQPSGSLGRPAANSGRSGTGKNVVILGAGIAVSLQPTSSQKQTTPSRSSN